MAVLAAVQLHGQKGLPREILGVLLTPLFLPHGMRQDRYLRRMLKSAPATLVQGALSGAISKNFVFDPSGCVLYRVEPIPL